MKKFFLSILTILYMTVSSGFAMEIHYCMGKETGVELFKTIENKKCSRCGMSGKKGGCCKDDHRFYKLADAHKNIVNDQNLDAPFFAIINIAQAYHSFLLPSVILTYPLSNSPPPGTDYPIYLLNRNFRL